MSKFYNWTSKTYFYRCCYLLFVRMPSSVGFFSYYCLHGSYISFLTKLISIPIFEIVISTVLCHLEKNGCQHTLVVFRILLFKDDDSLWIWATLCTLHRCVLNLFNEFIRTFVFLKEIQTCILIYVAT